MQSNKCAVLTEELWNTFASKKVVFKRSAVLLNEGFLSKFVSTLGVAGLRISTFFVKSKSTEDYLIFELLYHYHLEGYSIKCSVPMKS
jgi:hypothetical protein